MKTWSSAGRRASWGSSKRPSMQSAVQPGSLRVSWSSPGIHSAAKPGPKISYLRLFGYRQVWGLLIAKFLTDSAWFFFIFWLPKYLSDVRHLNEPHFFEADD